MEKLRYKTPALVLASALGLTACQGDYADLKPGQPGTVVDHHHRYGYTSINRVGNFSVPVYHPAQYDLDVKQCDRGDEKVADNAGCVIVDVRVDASTYEAQPIGSTYIVSNQQ